MSEGQTKTPTANEINVLRAFVSARAAKIRRELPHHL